MAYTYTLGIESTAHTLGIGIMANDTVLADVRYMYEPESGGIHPADAAQHHTHHAQSALFAALQEADLSITDLSAIAFAQGPGLGPCLDVGAVMARTLALSLDIPLIGVNHPLAHIAIGLWTTGLTDPIVVYVSGGNSQLLALSHQQYRVFGETLDVPIGNALDKFARTTGIPHPGGPEIERKAQNGSQLIQLPYVVKGMDFSFSGLLTQVQRKYQEGYAITDLCYSFQEYTFAMLVEATERALAFLEKDSVLLVGGVGANQRLCDMFTTMCRERGAQFVACPMTYAVDNGVMIAYLGWLQYCNAETTSLAASTTDPHWRSDEVTVTW